mgnify:CR=1 FL=1
MINILFMATKNIFQIEFPIRSSLRILFNQISTPSGLSEWFADNVNLNGKNYTFFWDGDEQDAELLSKKNNHLYILLDAIIIPLIKQILSLDSSKLKRQIFLI